MSDDSQYLSITENYNHLAVRRIGRALYATIDNPPINLITKSLLIDLIKFSQWVEEDEESTVLVLESSNPDFFIAHFDVEALLEIDSESRTGPVNSLTVFDELCERFQKMPKITICVVRGRVGGGGSEIAMSCDLRFAELESARMNQMEVPIGIIPGGGGTQRLPNLIGYPRAIELIVGGLDLDAKTGERWGYFNRSLPSTELTSFVNKFVQRVSSFDPAAVRASKQALQLTLPDFTEGLIEENNLFNERNNSENGRNLMRQFLKMGGQTIDQELRIEDFVLEVANEINSED
ncbi:MAG: enoyl-CoA hydratase/isomerase family protein [Actinomycetota bacterium]|nr:enoyl-CoA hydratase/isomerase family protein [Actinomycetota bacterium]